MMVWRDWGKFLARSAGGALTAFLLWEAPLASWGGELSARAVLWRLPTTIFENTPPGLSEAEKYELLSQGATEHWAVRTSTPDILEVRTEPEGESTVLLRLFRGDGFTVAAIGTDTGPVCTTELWRLDAKGGAEPMDGPAEPSILDFFATDTRIPPDVTASLPFCVRPDGLEVRPLFWTSIGLAHVMVDNAVFYLWTGKKFSKRVVALRRPPSPPAPEGNSSADAAAGKEARE